MLETQAFGFSGITDNEADIKINIEKTYGLNIIIPENVDYGEFIDCMSMLEKSIKKFPYNIIKEITDYYSSKGITTNVVFNKTEIIKELFSVPVRDESSVNIYIKTLESSLYSESCYASEQAMIYELSDFISDYILETYDIDKLKNEFSKFNEDYKNGNWEEDYHKVYINKSSANSFEEEIANLIWYAETQPSMMRNVNDGNIAIIHEKLKLLSVEFDKIFNSITPNTKLWLDAMPDEPKNWAKDTITEMRNNSLIPEEFNGLYEAYIKRGDFYKLILNMLHIKLGDDKLNNYFNLTDYEEHMALDPVKGEVFVADGMNYTSYYNFLSNNSCALYQAYQMGILNTDSLNEPDGYMTRFEIAKILTYIANELGMDITDFGIVNYNDIENVSENEKPYIYIAAGKGFLKGDGLNFKPFDYCTYQEAYIILMRFYNSI